jgi:transposase-like protein
MDVSRAATARKLAGELSRMAALAAELADEAVWQATRRDPAKDVARALGVSEATVRKAIQQHNRRRGALPEGAESDTRRPANRA